MTAMMHKRVLTRGATFSRPILQRRAIDVLPNLSAHLIPHPFKHIQSLIHHHSPNIMQVHLHH